MQIASLTREGAGKERETAILRQELNSQAHKFHHGDSELQNKLLRAEKRVAALEHAAQEHCAKAQRLEAERDGLKLKVQSLLEVSHQCRSLGLDISDVAATLEASAPLTPPKVSKPTTTAGGTSLPKGGISLVKASATRVATLEFELSTFRAKEKENSEFIASLREACGVKNAELAALRAKVAASKGGSDLASFQKLTEHANTLATELESLRQRAVDPQALEAAEQAQQAADRRAAAAESSLQMAIAELESFKLDVDKLRKDSEAATRAERKSVNLRMALDEAKAREAAACTALQLAEGKAAELQDRLERRDDALQKAQTRCRSLNAELHRLRQLQGLKNASQKGGREEQTRGNQVQKPSLSDETDHVEIMQLKSQCAAMAGHLQKAMDLQAAAVGEATAAIAERDEVAAELRKLKSELEDAQLQLQEAAAAAAAVRHRIAGTSSSPGGTFDQGGRKEDRIRGSASEISDEIGAMYHCAGPASELILDKDSSNEGDKVLRKLASQLQAANYAVAELHVEVAAEREKAEILRRRCALLENQEDGTKHYNPSEQNEVKRTSKATPATSCFTSESSSCSLPPTAPEASQDYTPPLPKQTSIKELVCSPPDTDAISMQHSLQSELEMKRRECEQLATAGAQADAAMAQVLDQLRAATSELQKSRTAAATAQETLHERGSQLQAAHVAVQNLENERNSLREELMAMQTAADRATESLTAQLEAEREAVAGDFDTLRNTMQDLSRQYQEMSSQLAAAQQERDVASQLAESASTEAAFHEQNSRAIEMQLQDASNVCSSLAEENRQLQGLVMELQRELALRTSEDRFGIERAQAALQRRAATAEGGIAMLETKLSDAQSEVTALRQRLAVQAQRSEELEALLAEERSKQFQRENCQGDDGECLGLLHSPDMSAVEAHRGPDAVDEAMIQRLAELESECQSLKSELEEERQRANEASEYYNGGRIDLLAELAQITSTLQEEQRRREDLQAMVQAALERHGQSSNTSRGCSEKSPDASKNVVKQLKYIAQGLQGLGRR